MFRRLLVATSAVLVLAACGGSGGDDPAADPSDSPTSSTPTPEASLADETTACLASGPWHLDTADFADQGLTYMQGLGIPISSLEASGDMTIQFTDDGLMAMSTNLTQHAVINAGVTVDATITRTDEGSADWAFTDAEADRLKFSNFEWLTENTSGSATASNGVTVPVEDYKFPTFDYSGAGAIIVACTETGMSLQARGAPLVAYFNH